MSKNEESEAPANSGPSVKEMIDSWRAQCWAYYLNGGGGDPYYFDHEAWLRMQQRHHY